MIEIIRAGLLTSIQDLGRTGHRHVGVALGGALDTLALRIANRLVDNDEGLAGLEFTVGQPIVLRFTAATRIALTGAECAAKLDEQPIHAWWSVPVAAGQVLTLGVPSRGMRAYLAIAGGIDVPLLLGSRATEMKSGFGGLEGRALRDGDCLAIGVAAPATRSLAVDAPAFGVKPPSWCDFAQVRPSSRGPRDYARSGVDPLWIRVIRGPEYADFTAAAQQALWHAEWTVTPRSNRMGYRLAGPALERREQGDLLSHAVLPGTIQVPPNGQPILLMGDAQVSGGYPKIGVAISADLWQLAQARLNTPLRFVECSPLDARRALEQVDAYLKHLDLAINQRKTAQTSWKSI